MEGTVEGAREVAVRNPDPGAELALRATEISDPREFRLEVLKLLGSLVGYESAIFADLHESREPVTLGVDAAKLYSIQYCETNYDRYATDMQRFWPVGQ